MEFTRQPLHPHSHAFSNESLGLLPEGTRYVGIGRLCQGLKISARDSAVDLAQRQDRVPDLLVQVFLCRWRPVWNSPGRLPPDSVRK